MKNSIEQIWKEGFLNEKSLVAPKINDLYNKKSIHLVDKMKRMLRVNLIVVVVLSLVLPIMHYFLDAIWQGVASSILVLLTAWYIKLQLKGLKTLDQGVNSLDYLKSFDRWIKDVISRTSKIVRFSYPLYFLIGMSTIWSTWVKQEKLVMATHQKFPDSVYVGNMPLFALVFVLIATFLMAYYSDKIYKFDVRLMYGCIFDKLESTIIEMEKLR